MECSRSDYSNLAADINLNEVTMWVGRWTQCSHPGTPHLIRLLYLLSVHSIYFHDSPSGPWVGNLSNTTRSRDQPRYYRACYCFFGLEKRVGWSDRNRGREDGKRYRRLASLSGLADKHRRTPISIWVPTDRRRCSRLSSFHWPQMTK